MLVKIKLVALVCLFKRMFSCIERNVFNSNTDIKKSNLGRAHVGVFVLKTEKVQVARSLAFVLILVFIEHISHLAWQCFQAARNFLKLKL